MFTGYNNHIWNILYTVKSALYFYVSLFFIHYIGTQLYTYYCNSNINGLIYTYQSLLPIKTCSQFKELLLESRSILYATGGLIGLWITVKMLKVIIHNSID